MDTKYYAASITPDHPIAKKFGLTSSLFMAKGQNFTIKVNDSYGAMSPTAKKSSFYRANNPIACARFKVSDSDEISESEFTSGLEFIMLEEGSIGFVVNIWYKTTFNSGKSRKLVVPEECELVFSYDEHYYTVNVLKIWNKTFLSY